MLDRKIWKPIDNVSPGYVGKHRNEEWRKRDEKFGKGRWQMAWLVGEDLLDYFEACELYEDAYYVYFQQRPEILEHLLQEASDVYDDDPSNVEAGTDYSKRGDVRTHIQDTAIRCCLKRLGRSFAGSKLIQIRDRLGEHPLSLALSPGQVPFHRMEALSFPDNLPEMKKSAWWLPGSVEDFYQRAKRICIKQD